MKFDFSGNKKLNQLEIKKMNEYFNKPDKQELINELEDNRKYNKKFSLILWLVVVLLTVISWFVLKNNTFIFVFVASFIISTLIYKWKSKKKNFKNSFMEEFLNSMFWNALKYSTTWDLFTENVKSLKDKTWLLNYYDRLDYVQDSLSCVFNLNKDDASIKMQWVEIKTSSLRRTKDRTEWRTSNLCYIFKLSFINSRFTVDKPITISRDYHNNIFKKILTFVIVNFIVWVFTYQFVNFYALVWSIPLSFYFCFIYTPKNKVNLENVDFEKEFDVSCDDCLLTRQILNPTMMQNIVDYVKQTSKKYEMFLYKNDFYVKYDVWSGYLELSTFKDTTESFVEFYLEIKYLMSFVKSVNLMYFDKNYFDRNTWA